MPGLVLSDLLKEEVTTSRAAQTELAGKFQSTLGELAERRVSGVFSLVVLF